MIKLKLQYQNKIFNIDETNDYVTKGGEGSIYAQNNICFKIYPDLSKLIPIEKIKELLELKSNKNIICPTDIILINNIYSGFTMNYCKNNIELCTLFTNTFLKNNHLNEKDLYNLIENMVNTIEFIHNKNYLLGDMNEMNFLVDNIFKNILFIDVNAYQTPSFPSSAITPLFQDHHTKGISKLTDWYGFAIIASKLFFGIHPFKGRHPNYSSSNNDIINRMKNNISIFNKNVILPPSVRPVDYAPTKYIEWFIDIFEKGKRTPPPNITGYVTVIKNKITNNFISFKRIFYKKINEEIKQYYTIGNNEIIKTNNTIYINNQIYYNTRVDYNIIFSPKSNIPFFVSLNNDNLIITDMNNNIVLNNISATNYLIYDHFIFYFQNGKITKLIINEINNKIIFSTDISWNVTKYSTKVFNNCAIMDLIQNKYIIFPYTHEGECKPFIRNIRVKEIDNYKIIEGKVNKNIGCFIGLYNNEYFRIFIIFDKFSDKYKILIENNIDVPIINFIVLDKNIVVSMNEHGIIKMFTTDINNYQEKIIQDNNIKDMIMLCKKNNDVIFFENNELFFLKSN